ncbi:hypothetical protein PV10_07589 [Exophiala mesophila]|uniref:Uncharacterized protein n=1 Tax=Exophiala mesophila TaxID=212818 RepID=A0A0D1ZTY0_EXOME|nr:uncharacterized protein PV10_07589 [Exophiala mesophila]KIV90268.1 hypothetical protein PV10_07589 [Exophiala mesophila]
MLWQQAIIFAFNEDFTGVLGGKRILSEEDSGPIVSRKTITSILEKSVVDRIESKKKIKKLQDAANAPSTAIHRRYWLTLFKQFAQATLNINKRLDPTPTGDDIARFLTQLPDHLQSRHDDGKIAWTLIKGARVQLERALAFEHEYFKLSKRDGIRLDATIQQLLNDGKITKEPVRCQSPTPSYKGWYHLPASCTL